MDKFTQISDQSENMIKEGRFYSLEDLRNMIPMLDDVTYHLLYLRFNRALLTETEIKDIELIIKRLQMNEKHFVNDVHEKFTKNNENKKI